MGVNCVEMPDTGYVGMMVNYNDEDVAMSMEQCCAMMLTKCMGIAEASAGAKVGVSCLSAMHPATQPATPHPPLNPPHSTPPFR